MIVLSLVGCLPIFLLVRLGFAIVWRVRDLHPPRVLAWSDAAALVLFPFVWSALEHVGEPKSLANLVELIYIGWFCCLCVGIRYFLATRNPARRPGAGGFATLAAVLLAAAGFAVFFPCLPE